MLGCKQTSERKTSVQHSPYYYDNSGGHWGFWILMIVAMLVFWGILAWAVVTIIRHKSADHGPVAQTPAGASSDALRILDERLARGDIDVDEYTRRRDLLKGSGPPPGS
jgi:putative membrane protein